MNSWPLLTLTGEKLSFPFQYKNYQKSYNMNLSWKGHPHSSSVYLWPVINFFSFLDLGSSPNAFLNEDKILETLSRCSIYSPYLWDFPNIQLWVAILPICNIPQIHLTFTTSSPNDRWCGYSNNLQLVITLILLWGESRCVRVHVHRGTCLCRFIYVYACRGACVCLRRTEVNLKCHSSGDRHLDFWDRVSHWPGIWWVSHVVWLVNPRGAFVSPSLGINLFISLFLKIIFINSFWMSCNVFSS